MKTGPESWSYPGLSGQDDLDRIIPGSLLCVAAAEEAPRGLLLRPPALLPGLPEQPFRPRRRRPQQATPAAGNPGSRQTPAAGKPRQEGYKLYHITPAGGQVRSLKARRPSLRHSAQPYRPEDCTKELQTEKKVNPAGGVFFLHSMVHPASGCCS